MIGINDDRLGPRFPDMCEPYQQTLVDRALKIARKEDIVAHKGVFVAVAGPNLKPERSTVSCGRSGGCCRYVYCSRSHRCCSLRPSRRRVFDHHRYVLPDALKPANVEEIIAVANEAEPRLTTLVKGVLAAENS